jgi:hypothetical protein
MVGQKKSIIYVRQEPYRDLYKNISDTLQEMRAAYPNVHFDIYIGGLRTRFPYSLLHMSTDRFLSHALIELDEISLTVKQVELDKLPLPEGFKVTFEHAVDHHFSRRDVIASHEKHS